MGDLKGRFAGEKLGSNLSLVFQEDSALALVATVSRVGGLRWCPLSIGRLLATPVATSAGRAAEAHLRSVTRRRLSGGASVVALLAILSSCKVCQLSPQFACCCCRFVAYRHTGGSKSRAYQGSLGLERSEDCRPGWDRKPGGWDSCLCPTIEQ